LIGVFQQVVLVSVAVLRGDADAADIRAEVNRRLGRDNASGAVHITLQRLETLKLIASQPRGESRRADGRGRRRYWITEAGQRALDQAKSEIERVWS
jgi:DNA-binding PadR family transcriptional regulator